MLFRNCEIKIGNWLKESKSGFIIWGAIRGFEWIDEMRCSISQ